MCKENTLKALKSLFQCNPLSWWTIEIRSNSVNVVSLLAMDRTQTINTISDAHVTERHQMKVFVICVPLTDRQRDVDAAVDADAAADADADADADAAADAAAPCDTYIASISRCGPMSLRSAQSTPSALVHRADTRRRASGRRTRLCPFRPKSRRAARRPGGWDPPLRLLRDGQETGLRRVSTWKRVVLLRSGSFSLMRAMKNVLLQRCEPREEEEGFLPVSVCVPGGDQRCWLSYNKLWLLVGCYSKAHHRI